MDLLFVLLVSNHDFFVFIPSKRRRMQGLRRAFNIVIVIGIILEQFIDSIAEQSFIIF